MLKYSYRFGSDLIMKKLITLPEKYNDSLIYKIDGVIIGVKDLSIGFNTYETLDTIEDTIDKFNRLNKDVFVSLNKNMYNSDLKYLNKVIELLKEKNISGILYYDIGVYNIVHQSNIPLYWNQEHLATNYMACKFWNKRGVEGVLISSDITIPEIIEIKEKNDMKLIVQVFGYTKMMASSRKLISNYLKYIGDNNAYNKYKIYDKISSKSYPIIEDDNGTITLSDKCLNGISYIDIVEKNNIDYILFDSINCDNIEDVIDKFNNKNEFLDKEEYFLSKKTIFRVKK